jgi:hypothetical protein
MPLPNIIPPMLLHSFSIASEMCDRPDQPAFYNSPLKSKRKGKVVPVLNQASRHEEILGGVEV